MFMQQEWMFWLIDFRSVIPRSCTLVTYSGQPRHPLKKGEISAKLGLSIQYFSKNFFDKAVIFSQLSMIRMLCHSWLSSELKNTLYVYTVFVKKRDKQTHSRYRSKFVKSTRSLSFWQILHVYNSYENLYTW